MPPATGAGRADNPRRAVDDLASAAGRPLLEMRGISKRFSGVHALIGVDFFAWAGEVHALMGENGAGKSTLMKILAGALNADSGEIRFDGRPFEAPSPGHALHAGIALIHQELSMVPHLSAAENIFLGSELRRGCLLSRRRMEAAASELLRKLDANFPPAAIVGGLSVAEQQLIEIARALRHKSRLLVMDEPTAALSEHESMRLFTCIEQLRAEGTAIVYISHRMAEVTRLASRITVLRDGAVAGTLFRGQIEPRKIVHLMVGRTLEDFHRGGDRRKPGRTVFRARGIGDGRRVHSASVDVRAGEVVGVAGLIGAGRTELARLIFGADRATEGSVELNERPIRVRSPAKAMESGISYLPEDRKDQGLFLDLSVQTNLSINVAGLSSRLGVLNRRELRRQAVVAMAEFNVRADALDTRSRLLSGGNQQKVLLSRVLSTKPQLLILDEPTRGVDVGAKADIYRMIDDLASKGVAILLISSELPEIIALSDRVFVMREGRFVGILDRSLGEVTQEAVMARATGVGGGGFLVD